MFCASGIFCFHSGKNCSPLSQICPHHILVFRKRITISAKLFYTIANKRGVKCSKRHRIYFFHLKLTTMALIQCPHCGNPSVSDRATHCPHCGKPVNRAASPTSSTPHGTLPPSHLPQRRNSLHYVLIVLAILFGGAIIAVTLYLNRESHPTTSSTASEVTTDNPTGEESTEEGTEQHNSVEPVSYTLKGTCDGTPFQVVLTRFGHGGINGDYKNLDSGTKMKLDGTWEGGNLEFTGRIQNVRYEFKLHSNENAPRALQTYYSGSLDIIWSGGQKYRDVDLTIVSKE